MVSAALLKGLAESSSLLAIVVSFVLLPSWFMVWLFGINDAFSYELFAHVFVFQFLFGVAACMGLHFVAAYLHELFVSSDATTDTPKKEHL
jgi:hypothetical protein